MNFTKSLPLFFALAAVLSGSCSKKEASASPLSVEVNEVEPTTPFGKQFTDSTSVVSDGEFVSSQLKDADYYIVYVSASW